MGNMIRWIWKVDQKRWRQASIDNHFDLDKHQEGKLGYVNWDVVYDKCTPPLYNGS